MSFAGRVLTALMPTGLPGPAAGRGQVKLVNDLLFRVPIAGHAPREFCYPETAQATDGVRIVMTIVDGLDKALDIRAASNLVIKVKNPADTVTSLTGSFYTNGMDGKLMAEISSSVIATAGTYFAQAVFTVAGETKHTLPVQFNVLANI